MGTGMTGMGTGTGVDTKLGILIRTRGTLTRVPAGYTHTRVHHYGPHTTSSRFSHDCTGS